jgi:hypothetical protein
VFRSFGQELPDIIWEFNQFCQGLHPCFNGNNCTLAKFDGSKGTKDLRFRKLSQQGVYYRRDGASLKQSQLVTGSLRRHDLDNVTEDQIGTLDDFYRQELDNGDCDIYINHGEAHLAMLENMKKRSVMAFQDDFKSWSDAGRDQHRGKLLMVDPADYNTH